MTPSTIETDLAIIGAGPTGLYGAFCAGFRGLRTVLVDALPQVGGQIAALYPEKSVRDVAGLPAVAGRELVASLQAQADAFAPTYLLGRQATALDHSEDGRPRLTLSDGTLIDAGAVVLTAGIGTFTPRPLPAGEEFLGRGLSYFVPDLSEHVGRDVVVVGGGDSALDWALALAPLARSVTLVHRRAAFRAHAASVTAAREMGIPFRVNCEVAELSGNDRVESVRLTSKGGEDELLPADSVIAALGFISDLGPLAGWGLELSGRSIHTDQRMQTNLPRVYAAGDVTEYPGKVRLMSVGFGEVATAVNNAAVVLDPGASLFPGHSTEAA
ncbi:NAD(P)/FAD-dependent oxidoreductase [Blastococcus sp. BMG 814]|uniref:Ferredoxin--NADP reductase n=1 Tax=Blastococcus carthaginiensis TaxID=3050034 RepID=A0ABT9IAC6_9ACTN|nr:NAD(P)/FAD-dependent oxidoreductase [Blastococcus carthaginiensis]MDP5182525.1 NAD(P)/FAD-dependent oxidoreductase [Blastococcus carthaginiensis]